MNRIGFIGLGNMAYAIIKGLRDANIRCEIGGFDVNSAQAERFGGLNVLFCENAGNLVQHSDYILLAVKPKDIRSVLTEIKERVSQNHVFVSIAAGVSAEQIGEILGFPAKVILVMPNTPLLIGMGATAMSASDKVSREELSFIFSVFQSCGIVEMIPIDKMKEIIPINSSSPAFVYLFAKYFAGFARDSGIDEKAAYRLFCETLKGSAAMLERYDYDADNLIKMVSSPNGTTVKALETFEKLNLERTLKSGLSDCVKRAYEMSEEL